MFEEHKEKYKADDEPPQKDWLGDTVIWSVCGGIIILVIGYIFDSQDIISLGLIALAPFCLFMTVAYILLVINFVIDLLGLNNKKAVRGRRKR